MDLGTQDRLGGLFLRTLDGPLRWRDNGPARVDVVSYAPERLGLSIDA